MELSHCLALLARAMFVAPALVALYSCGGGGGGGGDRHVEFRTVHDFDSANDGAYYPASGLTAAPDGNFYGISAWGGPSGLGTVYRLTADERIEVLHSFEGERDGTLPDGPLVLAKDGNSLWGTTDYANYEGGMSTYFRWSLDGEFKSFGYMGVRNHPNWNYGLVTGSDGNLYGATGLEWLRILPDGTQESLAQIYVGDTLIRLVKGDSASYLLRLRNHNLPASLERVSHDGVFTTLFTFDDVSPVGQNPRALVMGRDGNLRGYTNIGGAQGHGAVFMSSPQGEVTKIADLPIAMCGSLTEAQDGRLYAYTCPQDAPVGIASISPDGTFTKLYELSQYRPYLVPRNLMEYKPGHFYGVTLYGGAHEVGSIFELTVPEEGS